MVDDTAISSSPTDHFGLTDHFGECDGCGCPVLEELRDGPGGEPLELVCTSCGMGYVAFTPRAAVDVVADPEPARAA